MIMEIEGINGAVAGSIGRDYVGKKCTEQGMMIVCVNDAMQSRKGLAEAIGQAILDTFQEEKKLTKKVLVEYIEFGYKVAKESYSKEEAEGLSILICVISQESMGIIGKGSNKFMWIREGDILWETDESFVKDKANVHIMDNTLEEEDAILIATDGLWMPLRKEEILIDYAKSKTTKEWISYLLTRLGLLLDDESDCYSMMTIMVQDTL